MPSVVVKPTLLPVCLKIWAIKRVVVVLPFVPVIATIGTLVGAPSGNSISNTGAATLRGVPMLGAVCILKPGAAFTSTIAPST